LFSIFADVAVYTVAGVVRPLFFVLN